MRSLCTDIRNGRVRGRTGRLRTFDRGAPTEFDVVISTPLVASGAELAWNASNAGAAAKKAERSGRLFTKENEEIIDLDDISRKPAPPRGPLNTVLEEWASDPTILTTKRLILGREDIDTGYFGSAMASAAALGALGGIGGVR